MRPVTPSLKVAVAAMESIPSVKHVLDAYVRSLGDGRLAGMIVGGSVARGNAVRGWSDVDVLVIIEDMDATSLAGVRYAERELREHYNVTVDAVVTARTAIDQPIWTTHSKVRNFLFFAKPDCTYGEIPRNCLTIDDLLAGSRHVFHEQLTRFLRRNVDVNINDRTDLIIHTRKNMKLSLLLLRLATTTRTFQPNTFADLSAADTLPKTIRERMKTYSQLRRGNELASLATAQLRQTWQDSIATFHLCFSTFVGNVAT